MTIFVYLWLSFQPLLNNLEELAPNPSWANEMLWGIIHLEQIDPKKEVVSVISELSRGSPALPRAQFLRAALIPSLSEL